MDHGLHLQAQGGGEAGQDILVRQRFGQGLEDQALQPVEGVSVSVELPAESFRIEDGSVARDGPGRGFFLHRQERSPGLGQIGKVGDGVFDPEGLKDEGVARSQDPLSHLIAHHPRAVAGEGQYPQLEVPVTEGLPRDPAGDPGRLGQGEGLGELREGFGPAGEVDRLQKRRGCYLRFQGRAEGRDGEPFLQIMAGAAMIRVGMGEEEGGGGEAFFAQGLPDPLRGRAVETRIDHQGLAAPAAEDRVGGALQDSHAFTEPAQDGTPLPDGDRYSSTATLRYSPHPGKHLLRRRGTGKNSG